MEAFVQPRRTKGSAWQAKDIPAVVIETKARQRFVIIGDIWDEDDPKQLFFNLPAQRTLGELAKSLMAQLPKSAMALSCAEAIPSARFPFGVISFEKGEVGQLFVLGN